MFIDFSFVDIKEKFTKSLYRFPWVILIITLSTVLSWALIYDPNIFMDHDYMKKILFCLVLGIPISIGLTVLKEASFESKIKFQIDILIVLILTLSLIYFILPEIENRGFGFKYVQIAFIAHLFVSLAPFFKITKHENLEFWSYNYFLLFRILKSGVYALTFWIGLALAITTVNLLFKTEFSKAYGYLGVLLTLMFQTWFFIAGIPESFKSLVDNFKYPNELRIFTQFALVPITVVYLIILYAYSFKILIQWSLPSGYIGWLVSSISVLGAFTLLLIHPLRKSAEHRWVNIFWKYYFVLIIPLLGLLFLALSVRIFSYGITESRFVLTICGITLSILSFYFIFKKNENIKWIPFSLMFFSLLTLAGPLDATRLSYNSQFNRFKSLIAKNNITSFENLRKTSAEDATSLNSIIYYLQNRNGKEVETYIEDNFKWIRDPKDPSPKNTTFALIDELYKIKPSDESNVNLYSNLKNNSSEPFSFAKAKIFFPLNLNNYVTIKHILKIKGVEWSVALVDDKVAFNNTKTEEIFEISLSSIFSYAIEEKQKVGNTYSDNLPEQFTSFAFEFKDLKGTFVINSIIIQINNKKRSIQQLEGLFLVN